MWGRHFVIAPFHMQGSLGALSLGVKKPFKWNLPNSNSQLLMQSEMNGVDPSLIEKLRVDS